MGNEVIKPKITFGNELRFTPYVWAKLLYMRDKGATEVAGYGVTATEDPLLVTDFVLVKQECTGVSFDLDPNDGAEYMERMMDAGLMPWQYSNILCHTHPGNSPTPSFTDETNFQKAFSHPNWAIMFIIADDGGVCCRLKVNVGPGVVRELKVVIDYSVPFGGSDVQRWNEEYQSNVSEQKFRMTGKEGQATVAKDDPLWYDGKKDRWINFDEAQQSELDRRDDSQKELDALDCYLDASNDYVLYWDNEKDVWYSYDHIEKKWYLEDLDTANGIREIATPEEPWAAKVMAWAEKYAGELISYHEED